MTRRALWLFAALSIQCVTGANAQDGIGRYQALPLTKEGRLGDRVLIIDTKTGDIWTWADGVSTDNKSGSGLRYEGATISGEAPGEMVARQGYGLPAIQKGR
jgi:hypothetical protein